MQYAHGNVPRFSIALFLLTKALCYRDLCVYGPSVLSSDRISRCAEAEPWKEGETFDSAGEMPQMRQVGRC